MDTALTNGDFAPGSNGRPQQIQGTREILQRAMIRLNVPIGGFDYDAALGSRLHTLNVNDADINAKALVMAQEALRPLSSVAVAGVKLLSAEPPAIAVQLNCGGENAEIEVRL